MTIIPALDLMDGKAVRLTAGDFNRKKTYDNDPLSVARSFEEAGFTRLHIVDLDGARNKRITNLHVLEAIASHTSLQIDFGGGIASAKDVGEVLAAGATQCAIGSVAVTRPANLKDWVDDYGREHFLIGADTLDGRIKISGWLEDGGVSVFDLLRSMQDLGLREFFCTDISKDGLLQGPATDLYKEILNRFPGIDLIASGGISNIDDLKTLRAAGCKGAIVGKAIYEQKITLHELAQFNEAC